jgi:hypothetical protein
MKEGKEDEYGGCIFYTCEYGTLKTVEVTSD